MFNFINIYEDPSFAEIKWDFSLSVISYLSKPISGGESVHE